MLPDAIIGPGEVELQEVPGGRYVSHRYIGPYSIIAITFQALFTTWLPGSGFELDDRPALELYRDAIPTPPESRVTDLLIPLR